MITKILTVVGLLLLTHTFSNTPTYAAEKSCFTADGSYYIFTWSMRKPDGAIRFKIECDQIEITNLNPGFESTEVYQANQKTCMTDAHSLESFSCTTYIPGAESALLEMTRESHRNTTAGPMNFTAFSTLEISKNVDYTDALSGHYVTRTEVNYPAHPEYNDRSETIREIVYGKRRLK